jgi:hypothetical protein
MVPNDEAARRSSLTTDGLRAIIASSTCAGPEPFQGEAPFPTGSGQRDVEIVENNGKARRPFQRRGGRAAQRADRPVVECKIGLAVQPRQIADSVDSSGVLMDRDRPRSCQTLTGAPSDIARDAHSNRIVTSEVDQPQFPGGRDCSCNAASSSVSSMGKSPTVPLRLSRKTASRKQTLRLEPR